MSKKKNDDRVLVEDRVTPDLRRELEEHAAAGSSTEQPRAESPVPAPSETEGISDGGNGRPAHLRGPRKPRDPDAPRITYLVIGEVDDPPVATVVASRRSLRGARRFCDENSLLLRTLVRNIRIYRARICGAFA
jgi:hypothetical protein